MSVYIIKLTKKEVIAKDTMAFHFEKPENFHFKAGQYSDYIQINPSQTDSEGSVRSFTLACAPFENDICFVTRMRDTAFKRIMKDMEIGTEIKLDGPNGDLILRQNSSPAIFLTGGIGVTPARSIIAQATHDHLDQQIYLFYSTKDIDSAVYLDEFNKYAKINKNFHFIPAITDPLEKRIQGEAGRIDGDMIRKYVSEMSKANYYVTGPVAMVQSLQNVLIDNGVKKHNILIEKFEGYL